jgi:hypothetical protein
VSRLNVLTFLIPQTERSVVMNISYHNMAADESGNKVRM